MKKLLLILLASVAFACGDQSDRRDNDNEAGTNTEEMDNSSDETVSPDTTNVERDTATYEGSPDSRQ
jgi:hypothetical protein